jgi:hypothetical protein
MKPLLTILTFLILFTNLEAQNRQTGPDRKGFVIGLSAGAGYMVINGDAAPETFDGADISLPNLKIGWMLKPNTAILLSMPGMAYDANGVDRSVDALVPTVQHWIKPDWWINGGIGLSMDSPAFYEDDKKGQDKLILGPAAMFSTGYELYQKGRFTIDVQTTIQVGRLYTDQSHYDACAVLAGIGFNFY